MTWSRAVPYALLALLLLSPAAAEPGEAPAGGAGTSTATPTPTPTSTSTPTPAATATAVENPPLPSGERAGVRGPAAPTPTSLSGPKLLPPFGLVPPNAPVLRSDRPVRCLFGPSGAFRAQCDEAARRCLVAQDALLDEAGHPMGPLEAAGPCSTPAVKEADLAGWEIVPAQADTPPGYRRDERQRLSQVSFDFGRRAWLGFGYAVGGQPWQPEWFASSGIRIDLPFEWGGARALGRFRLLEGSTAVDGSAAELTALSADFSRGYPHPLLRLTTFFGTPRRFDPPLYAGLWGEALRFETLKTRSGDRYERTGYAAAAVTLDFWRSADFGSFVRLRAGGGYEEASGRTDGDWTLHWLLEGDVVMDGDGLSHLRGLAGTELILPSGAGPAAPLHDRRWRHQVRAEWEQVLLSVNDQPVSVVLQARASQRDDVPDWSTSWTGEATLQLRVNLWAPARRTGAPQGPAGVAPAPPPASSAAATEPPRQP